MLIIGIVLGFAGLGYLCWLLFALAVHALPFFAGVTAGLAAFHSGSDPIGAIVVGLIAGVLTLVVGQIAFAVVRSPVMRATPLQPKRASPTMIAPMRFLFATARRSRGRRGVGGGFQNCARH